MMGGGVVLVLVVLVVLCKVKAELFTSIADLERVLYSEKEVVDQLRYYADKEEDKVRMIRMIADEYELHSKEAISKGVHTYMTNPVNAYLLVRKLTIEWKDRVVDLLKSNSAEDFLTSIQTSLTSFPSQEDLTGAAMALLRLQDTYSLTTEDIANGQLLGIKESPALTAGECFDIAKQAYFQNDYYHAIPWLKQALDIIQKETIKTAEKANLLDYMAFATYMQGNVRAALNLTEEWIKLKPDNNDRAYVNKRNYEELLRKSGESIDSSYMGEIKNEQILDAWKGSQEFKDYESLCRGEDIPLSSNASNKDLKCYLRRHTPYFMLRPLKEEQLSINPGVWVFHDMVTETQIEKIKQLATPMLHRSAVFLGPAEENPLVDFRTSKSAWIHDYMDPEIAKLSHKISGMCNLTLENVEELQVLNYGIGGHYEPHFDFARDWETNTFESGIGNRIATNICYLSNVQQGGLTVFPSLGIKIYPQKGSCALWYNMLKSGQGDYTTKHAGCPVLSGDKWVANKWFHERGQEFIRPCSPEGPQV